MAGSSSTMAMRRGMGGLCCENGDKYTSGVVTGGRAVELVRRLPELIGRMALRWRYAARVRDLNPGCAERYAIGQPARTKGSRQHASESGNDRVDAARRLRR